MESDHTRESLRRDHMLAAKNGMVVVVGGPEEMKELKEEGWSFKVYTPKPSSKPEPTPNWIEQTPTGMRIKLGDK